jgi:heme oxygenase (biliverdin-IX-beta and delta-forming)
MIICRGMTIGPILARLRRATGPQHERLDSALRIIERLSSSPEREALIEAYGRLHRSADRAIRPWLVETGGLDYTRRRTAADGASPPFPPIASEPEALGAMYVLEGATLGGRVIRRELAARGVSLAGLEFLDPYGEEAGERWRSFVAVLESRGAADPDGVERGAIAAFSFAEACLAEEEAFA